MYVVHGTTPFPMVVRTDTVTLVNVISGSVALRPPALSIDKLVIHAQGHMTSLCFAEGFRF